MDEIEKKFLSFLLCNVKDGEPEEDAMIEVMIDLIRTDEMRGLYFHDTGQIGFVGNGMGWSMYEEATNITLVRLDRLVPKGAIQ